VVAEGILSTNFGMGYLLLIISVLLAPISETLAEKEDEVKRLE
jgi:hypothetical protein